MQQQATASSFSQDLQKSLVDYAPIVGLTLGKANVIGALSRIESMLTRAGRSSDQITASWASETLSAVLERERMNGTPWERLNPTVFADLTRRTANLIEGFFEHLNREADK